MDAIASSALPVLFQCSSSGFAVPSRVFQCSLQYLPLARDELHSGCAIILLLLSALIRACINPVCWINTQAASVASEELLLQLWIPAPNFWTAFSRLQSLPVSSSRTNRRILQYYSHCTVLQHYSAQSVHRHIPVGQTASACFAIWAHCLITVPINSALIRRRG